MKKLLFSAILLSTYCSSFAFLTQGTYRWRNNDGDETTATWKAAQNTPITYNSIHEVLRLRVELYNTNTNNIALEDSLQYTTTPTIANSWINILANDNSRAFIMAGPNSAVAQNTPTTTQITGNTYAFVPGKVMTDTAVLKFVTIPPSSRSEFEWAIMGTNNTAPNTTYYFRHWGSSANSLPPGATYPSLTTGAALPIKLSSFSVKKDGKKVKLDWSTASEQNNDRFEVQKSNDGRIWNTIATLKGQGTSNEVSNYSSYDNKPSTGLNYYRLKQFDVDGRSTYFEVKSLKFDDHTNATLTVSPNPTRGVINFKLDNVSANNASVSMSNSNGKVIYRDVIKAIDAGKLYRLNLAQKPAPGMYILNIQAEGVMESIKVIIQ